MSKNNSFMKTAVVAVVSAIVGGVASGVTVNQLNNNNNSNVVENKVASKKGTAQVSNTASNSKSQMGAAFKQVSGAVVSVVNYQKQQNNNDDMLSSLFGEIYGGSDEQNNQKSNKKDSALQEYSEGSGVIYSNKSGKGYIVTNNHVVSGSDKLEIILKDGTKVAGKLVGTDKVTDLAVIEISGDKVPQTAEFGNSSQISEGDSVIAIGSPLGSQYATSVTEGIISSKSRTITTQDQETGQDIGQATVIQTDAAINPGNSGGPLVNAAGQIIGINSMKLASSTDGTSVEGMGFAIPSNEVVKIINQLVTKGKVIRPALGIRAIDLDQVQQNDQQSVLKLPAKVTKGVLLASVDKTSPARIAGLKKYDVIVAVDDTNINNIADLHTELYKHEVGDTVTVKYYHNGSVKKAQIKLTKSE